MVIKIGGDFSLEKDTAHTKTENALKRTGWLEPSELLVQKAIEYLTKDKVSPETATQKTLCDKLRQWKPPELSPPKNPSPGRKYIDLLILADALTLQVPVDFSSKPEEKVAELEKIIRRAATKLVEPHDVYARETALRYNITFGGKIFDCFGFWERNNQYCARCLDREACFEVVKKASLGALVNSAIVEFKTGEDLRESQPLRALQLERSTNENGIAALIDRKSLLTWIGQEFPKLVRVDYTESVNFQISHPYRKRMVLLKIDKFTARAYNVIFNAISDAQAQEFKLTKVRNNWTHTNPDILQLQDEIRKYLSVAMDIPAISAVLSEEEKIKQEIQQKLVAEWTGILETRSDHDVFIDSRRQKILRFSRVPNKGFRLDFSRWGREKAAENGLKYTSSGARYEGYDRKELERLLHIYLRSIQSNYFGPRHTLLVDQTFS